MHKTGIRNERVAELLTLMIRRIVDAPDSAITGITNVLKTAELDVMDIALVIARSDHPQANETESRVQDLKAEKRELKTRLASALEFIENHHGPAARRQFEFVVHDNWANHRDVLINDEIRDILGDMLTTPGRRTSAKRASSPANPVSAPTVAPSHRISKRSEHHTTLSSTHYAILRVLKAAGTASVDEIFAAVKPEDKRLEREDVRKRVYELRPRNGERYIERYGKIRPPVFQLSPSGHALLDQIDADGAFTLTH